MFSWIIVYSESQHFALKINDERSLLPKLYFLKKFVLSYMIFPLNLDILKNIYQRKISDSSYLMLKIKNYDNTKEKQRNHEKIFQIENQIDISIQVNEEDM
jgi:phosphopantetheine adenylyltransferase